jgi:hypothetical protein
MGLVDFRGAGRCGFSGTFTLFLLAVNQLLGG